MQIGTELAGILAGSWRQRSFRKHTFSSENLHRHAPLLASAGIAALTWFRIRRHTSELSRQVVNFYHREYLCSTMRAAVHEAELERLIEAFHAAGIRSILLKGWSVGRLYPESGLRPSGDIDLWIDPEQRGAAEVFLQDLALTQPLDLEHDQLRRFEDRSFAEFYASCESVQLGSTSVKVLRREDQVRILCLHFLKHGGWRPIWLCDIAVVLELQTGAFDWTRCLGTDARRARWIGCTVALARELLDARIPLGAPSNVTSSPPQWLTETVLREWSDRRPPSTPALAISLRSLWHRPWKMEAAMRDRWRNSIQATVDCNGTFNGLPRWIYQARDAASRAMRFLPKVWHSGCLSTLG
jgi:hypothetical protein